jgi:hypothetical protein
MEILNSIVSWVIKKRIHQIELFKKYPAEVQSDWLRKLIDSGKGTEFGKKYRFRELRTHDQFMRRVRIQDYDTLKKYILRMKHGEKNVLWPGTIRWFAKSSGTTSDKSKFIPVSKEALEECHYKGGKDLLSIYYNAKPESKLFSGKGLVIGGSSTLNSFSSRSKSSYGDLSSIIIDNLPYWAEYHRTPAKSVALMPKWEDKIELLAQAGAQENVTNISGVPSWNLVLLKRILEITGKENMLEVWPNFELYAHGGVSFKPYKHQYEELFPSPDVTFLETYNASEGFFGIQDEFSKEENDMLLMLDYGIYYEFMPMDQLGKEYPMTLRLDEVEVGVNYALVISTNAGLWRYMLGDTIQFTNLDPYRIRVSGRTKYYINAFGEELIADNADEGLKIACEKTGAEVKDYTAAPYFHDDARGHEWVIEFNREPENLEYFVELLDNALKSVNSDYEAKRYHDMNMNAPIVHVAPNETFYRWLKKKKKLGGQNKVPRLSNTRDTIDTVLELMQK